MNGKILQSNSEKHMGNIIGVGCNQKMIDDAVSFMFGQTWLCRISHMSLLMYVTDYSKRIACHFMALYGCQIWDFHSKVTNKLYVA